MSEQAEFFKDLAELAFGRLERATKELTEKEIDWRPLEEANSIRWILTHLSRICNVGFPRIFRGDPDYTPAGWPDDYGSTSISLEEVMGDLETGKTALMSGLGELTTADLEAEIPLWGGTRTRSFALMAYLSEIIHHGGQIAYLKGAIGRRRETDEHFLL